MDADAANAAFKSVFGESVADLMKEPGQPGTPSLDLGAGALATLWRKAEAACNPALKELETTDIGRERVADLELIAAMRDMGGGWVTGAMYGAPVVLALLKRIAYLEETQWAARGCVHGIRGPLCPECPDGKMVPE